MVEVVVLDPDKILLCGLCLHMHNTLLLLAIHLPILLDSVVEVSIVVAVVVASARLRLLTSISFPLPLE